MWKIQDLSHLIKCILFRIKFRSRLLWKRKGKAILSWRRRTPSNMQSGSWNDTWYDLGFRYRKLIHYHCFLKRKLLTNAFTLHQMGATCPASPSCGPYMMDFESRSPEQRSISLWCSVLISLARWIRTRVSHKLLWKINVKKWGGGGEIVMLGISLSVNFRSTECFLFVLVLMAKFMFFRGQSSGCSADREIPIKKARDSSVEPDSRHREGTHSSALLHNRIVASVLMSSTTLLETIPLL